MSAPAGYALAFDEDFSADDLDPTRWLPAHLPQWSSRAQAAARYRVGDGRLRLYIAPDQRPWCPELDGSTRVSSLQTGVFSGPLDSAVGQHRFSPHAVVREEQPATRLYTPRYGRLEARLQATADPRAMVAFWLIGYEDRPERSGEICVCEIFGRDVAAGSVRVGMGVHPFGDPQLVDDFEQVELPIDATAFHVYTADWAPTQVAFSVDGQRVKVVDQSPDYPMQLMLGIYRFDDDPDDGPPSELVVDWVRGFRPLSSPR